MSTFIKDVLHFDWPMAFLLVILLVPVILTARRSIGVLAGLHARFALALRLLVIALLIAVLARPIWQKQAENITTTLILDGSQSIPSHLRATAINLLDKAARRENTRDDRLGIITVGRSATIEAVPHPATSVKTTGDAVDPSATNLADAVRLALAMAPPDTANRVILASDGNENIDFILNTSSMARAAGVPIDVLPITYAADHEVIFDRLLAPARARRGQPVTLKLLLRSTHAVTGRIVMRINGDVVDVNGEAAGNALPVTLEAGPNAFFLTLHMDQPGRQRFEAIFEPDSTDDDAVARNNQGVAVTFVEGEGRVLVIDDSGLESAQLHRALTESLIAVDVRTPSGWNGIDELAGYDAVVLANVPRWQMTDQQVRDLHTYVHDLGGGFVMLGGDTSFGAGGWIGSELARVIPVDLEPPPTRNHRRGALAIVIDCSGSMSQPVAGTRSNQQEIANEAAIAGIAALSSLDYVTVVAFSGAPSLIVPLTVRGDGGSIARQVRGLGSGGGTYLYPALDVAVEQLLKMPSGTKHIVVMTDGQTAGDPSEGIERAERFARAGITMSTIAIGDGADINGLARLAAAGEGRPYRVESKGSQIILPQIMIKETQIMVRSLIQEDGPFPATVSSLPGPVTALSSAPAVEGYVLTAARAGLAQTSITINTSEGNDPLYAFWNYGLGKSIAFTSDITGRWGSSWVSWSGFKSFWEQSIRWVMRSSAPSNVTLQTRLDGEMVEVELNAQQADGSSALNFLSTTAVVVDPESNVIPLTLTQVASGRYLGSFSTSVQGAYLVNVAFSSGAGDQRIGGNVQAAVCVPYPREFSLLAHNAALLHDVARQTRGRILHLDDPQPPDLFAREHLTFPFQRREIWDLLIAVAACVFLFDVAVRRLVMDRAAAAALAGRVLGRKEKRGSASVAAWKTARAARSTAAASREVLQPEPQQPSAAESTFPDMFTPAETETTPASAASPIPVEEEPLDPQATSSRLLAAKRRALRQHLNEEGEDDPKS